MITWNYRVFREADNEYVFREVFYDDDGAIVGCAAQSADPSASSLDELANTLRDFQAALQLPVLTLSDIPQQQPSIRARAEETYSSADVRARLGLPVKRSSKPAA